MKKTRSSGHGTQSLSRALAVLDAVARGHSTLLSIGGAVGTSRSTTHRLVHFLQYEGFVRYVEGRGYRLGSRLIELGAAALEQMPLLAVAHPILEQLSLQASETVHLSIRDGDDIVYIDKISTSYGLEMRSHVGYRKPIAVTGTGKAQMLDLPESEWQRLHALALAALVSQNRNPPKGFPQLEEYLASMRSHRKRGFALEIEENEPAVSSVAAPVRDAQGVIVAGISVAGVSLVLTMDRLMEFGPIVEQAARAISKELGYSPPAPLSFV